MLHCIQQTPTVGGENEFSDSFNVAEQMKKDYPGFYKILCETPVDYIDVGDDHYGKFYRLHTHTTFRLDILQNILQCYCLYFIFIYKGILSLRNYVLVCSRILSKQIQKYHVLQKWLTPDYLCCCSLQKITSFWFLFNNVLSS